MIPREVISCLMARSLGERRGSYLRAGESSTSFKLWETFPRGAGVWLSVISEMYVVAKARRRLRRPGGCLVSQELWEYSRLGQVWSFEEAAKLKRWCPLFLAIITSILLSENKENSVAPFIRPKKAKHGV